MTTTAIVSSKPLRQVGEVKELLANEGAVAQLRAVAAAHMTPERMMRLLALSIEKTPDIGRCTPMSVLGVLMTCSSLGLEPNTSLQHAYIIPRRNSQKGVIEATLQIGYRGYVQLAHNSGQIAGIDAGVHYSDDVHWKYMKGAHGVLEHEPGPENGEKLHAYATVTLANGNAIWAVWPWAKVIAHRDKYSDAYRNAKKKGAYALAETPWVKHEDLMAMKTMVRQLSRWMPMSSEIVRAAQLDGSRANYATFAVNPLAGLPEPIGDEDSDADVEHDEDGVITEGSLSAGGAAETPGPNSAPSGSEGVGTGDKAATDGKAALAEVRAKAAQAVAANKVAPQEQRPKPEHPAATEPEKAALPTYDSMVRQLRTDLYSWGRGAEDMAEFIAMYAPHLGIIAEGNPGLHADLQAEINAYADGADAPAEEG